MKLWKKKQKKREPEEKETHSSDLDDPQAEEREDVKVKGKEKEKKSLRFWKKKKQNEVDDGDTNDISEEMDQDESGEDSVSSIKISKTEPDDFDTGEPEIVDDDIEETDVTVNDDSAEIVTSDIDDETALLDGQAGIGEIEEETPEDEIGKVPEYVDVEEEEEPLESGVLLFGYKVEGMFQKLFLGVVAVTLIPPTFLFTIALLLCVFLLLFPIVAIVTLAALPAIVLAFFIVMATLPVLFPALLIFMLITEDGTLSAFDRGKLLILKLHKWTLPTI